MTGAANVYGQSLYELAAEEGLAQELLPQLQVLQESFRQEPEFLRLLASPALPKVERCGIIDASFRGKVHPYLLNFMKILAEKGYIRHFGGCCAEFTRRYNDDHGILTVTAVTAVALTPEQSAKLTARLEQTTGKTVALRNRIDPSILGGVRLDYDGKCVDGTLAHRLESIRSLLNNTVL